MPDVLIIGAGPAGCAAAVVLARRGWAVTLVEQHRFPRDKVCGGWITPQIVSELQLDPADYARGRAFQPICGFRTSRMGDPEVQTSYGRPVSYGIRRYEFDDYLLKRCGARGLQGVAFENMHPREGGWVVNGNFNPK